MKLSRPDVLFMSVCTAFIVANLYYCQPLIVLIAREFHIPDRVAGRITYLTQAGYAAGLFFLVPLGDMFERKKQILICTILTIGALILAAAAPSFFVLGIASVLIGFSSIVPQLILPLAAHLSSDEKRGQVLGTIMGGLLIGILLSRTLSGAIGHWLGWRSMFYIAAGVCLFMLAVIAQTFPKSQPNYKGSYRQLMASLWNLVKTQPLLCQASVINAFAFAIFGAFWTTMVLLLANPPFNFSSDKIGLFGLAGTAGAFAAPVVGKLSNSKKPAATVQLGILLHLLSFIIVYFASYSIWLLALGIIVFDIGQQAIHVTNQTRVYALAPESRNRLNTIFMSASFVGAASGSALGLLFWKLGGWPVTVAGCLGLIILNLFIFKTAKETEKPL